jgi:hypothetical protein
MLQLVASVNHLRISIKNLARIQLFGGSSGKIKVTRTSEKKPSSWKLRSVTKGTSDSKKNILVLRPKGIKLIRRAVIMNLLAIHRISLIRYHHTEHRLMQHHLSQHPLSQHPPIKYQISIRLIRLLKTTYLIKDRGTLMLLGSLSIHLSSLSIHLVSLSTHLISLSMHLSSLSIRLSIALHSLDIDRQEALQHNSFPGEHRRQCSPEHLQEHRV